LRYRAAGPLLAALLVGACGGGAVAGDQARPIMKWGADAEGGAPFVEADPADPSKMRGFDVEVAQMIATGLGREPQFVQVAWPQIESSVERGDFEVGLSGFEDRPELRARRALSVPYFEFREVIAVRTADSARFRTMADLAGKRVGTLAATLAWEILLAEQKKTGLVPVSYDIDTHPYTDLVAGRIDAVLLDHIIAQRSVKRVGGIVIQPGAVATSHYVAVFASKATALRDSANVILRARMRDGSLERTYRNWNIWDESQAAHFARVLSVDSTSASASARPTGTQSLASYLPGLMQAAGVTLAISVLAMFIAIVLGIGIASGRVYGGTITRLALTVYVEVMRGTPVLLQLFVIYYGLAAVIKLPAFAAAVIGLGLNYAAYESEIYRAALEAVPRAQLEAARTLGFSEVLTLRLIRGPQALRLALAPMTNDFVALLKDSSLVSVITVIELTKASSIYAVNVGSWLVPGILCAAVYLMMSLPLSRLARRLEKKWRIT
jgi:polar amino acid transport system substrate-binding protein